MTPQHINRETTLLYYALVSWRLTLYRRHPQLESCTILQARHAREERELRAELEAR